MTAAGPLPEWQSKPSRPAHGLDTTGRARRGLPRAGLWKGSGVPVALRRSCSS